MFLTAGPTIMGWVDVFYARKNGRGSFAAAAFFVLFICL